MLKKKLFPLKRATGFRRAEVVVPDDLRDVVAVGEEDHDHQVLGLVDERPFLFCRHKLHHDRGGVAHDPQGGLCNVQRRDRSVADLAEGGDDLVLGKDKEDRVDGRDEEHDDKGEPVELRGGGRKVVFIVPIVDTFSIVWAHLHDEDDARDDPYAGRLWVHDEHGAVRGVEHDGEPLGRQRERERERESRQVKVPIEIAVDGHVPRDHGGSKGVDEVAGGGDGQCAQEDWGTGKGAFSSYRGNEGDAQGDHDVAVGNVPRRIHGGRAGGRRGSVGEGLTEGWLAGWLRAEGQCVQIPTQRRQQQKLQNFPYLGAGS
ncbi:hypothetical protein DFJ73DRAFT_808904 [Zopfochytrium polystomum]|nr:hypothetical protein DFJ73DRAFT_808904 [Zopfochytrium polystomum]